MKERKEIEDKIAEYKKRVSKDYRMLDMKTSEINIRSRIAELNWVLEKEE